MPLPRHPRGTYVGLFGSHGGDWRERCAEQLQAEGIPCHDPTDDRWSPVNHENGDRYQDLIDDLVSEQNQAILGSRCVVFHLAGKPDDDSEAPESLAARFELGLLSGRGIPTFVYLGDGTTDYGLRGHNYLLAAVEPFSSVVVCPSLEDATRRAVRAWRALEAATGAGPNRDP